MFIIYSFVLTLVILVLLLNCRYLILGYVVDEVIYKCCYRLLRIIIYFIILKIMVREDYESVVKIWNVKN